MSEREEERIPLDVRIGRKVVQCRTALLLGQSDLARHLNVDVSDVECIESGYKALTPSQILALSRLLQVQPGWFFEI